MVTKNEVDSIPSSLEVAARQNNVPVCERTYGHAASANISANAKALRIAAENKSYDAFERMLEISGRNAAAGVTTVYSIGLGPDWEKVEQLAKGDKRIADTLQRYDHQIDSSIETLFQLTDVSEISDAEEKSSGFKRAFQWAAALTAPFGMEAPQRAFVQAGQAWDYTKARIGSLVHRKPKI